MKWNSFNKFNIIKKWKNKESLNKKKKYHKKINNFPKNLLYLYLLY